MLASFTRLCLANSTLASCTLLGACSHDKRPAYAEAPRAYELKSAVNDVVRARCNLEQRCNNIAAGKKYDDRQACESKLQGSVADDLNTQDCPNGVDHDKLSECLNDIKAESCSNPLDSMSRWNACRTGNICLH
jgi:hypothetical protein